MAQSAAKTIRDIQLNRQGIQNELYALRTTLFNNVQASITEVRASLESQIPRLEDLHENLASLEKEGGNVGPAAKQLRETIGQFKNTAARSTSISEKLAGFRLEAAESLPAFLISVAGRESPARAFANDISSARSELNKLPQAAKFAREDIAVILSNARQTGRTELAGHLEKFEAVTLESLLASNKRLGEQFPALQNLLSVSEQILGKAESDNRAVERLSEGNYSPILRNLGELDEGKIRLRDIGAGKGDQLRIVVRLQGQSAEGRDVSRAKELEFEFQYLRSYTDYSGQLVFVAPAQRPDRHNFQASAAVLATSRWGFAEPSGLQKPLSWLDLGIGPHVATLNQVSATAETGVGLSLSVRDNLLTFGYGWNLGVPRNPPYYFVGIGLLEMLQQFRTVQSPNAEGK